MSCRGLFRCMLKAFNFILALVGAGIVLYALFILKKWESQRSGPPVIPSPLGPPILIHDPRHIIGTPLSLSKQESDASQIYESDASKKYESDASTYHLLGRKLPLDPERKLHAQKLPEAWFIYLFLAVGIVVCLITFSGHIAAETTNGCCLSFLVHIFVTMLIIVEAGVATFVLLDHQWDKDLPYDPTGQFDNIKNFIEANLDFCKWVGLAVAIVEGLALLSALIVRAIGPASRGNGYDSDDEYSSPRSGLRQPFINPQTSGAMPAMPGGDPRSSRGDAWTARMRDKYGLNTTEFTYNTPETKRFSATPTQGEQDSGRCAVM